jgi:VWFA-related protein
MENLTVTRVLLVFALLSGTLLGQAGGAQEAPKDASAVAPAASSTVAGPAATSTPVAAASRARFVPVLISATDAGGNPVTGLTKEQFSIVDTNQAAQPLQVFKAADIPLHLAVVLLAAPGSFSQQQAAAIDLVQKVVRPKIDEAFVVTARGKKPWPSDRLEWKQDPAELVKIIDGLDRSAGLADAFNFDLQTSETEFNFGSRSTVQTFATGGPTVFDAVYAMMNSDPRPARRVIVIFREAWPHSQGFGQQVNTRVEDKLAQVIGVAQELHIATFVIGLEDPKFNGITDNNIGKNYIVLSSSESGGAVYDAALEKAKLRAYEGGKTNVQRLAAETGGAAFWSVKKNYTDAVTSIANLLAGQYIVTFTPTDAPTPVHTLKVTGSSGAKMLAQTTFFYGTPK